jgi:hypothetical protein
VLLAAALLPAAADPDTTPAMKRIDVIVTASSGGSVYLDKGRVDGIAEGDLVLLYSTGAGSFEAFVRRVSKSSSRVELPPLAPTMSVSDRGEIFVPLTRLELLEEEEQEVLTAEEEAARAVPDHPEWTAVPQEWDGETPLLAAAWNRTPDEKPTRLRGRVYFLGQKTWDDEYGSNEFTTARLGTEVFIENPFKKGGEIHLDAEFNLRRTKIEDADDSTSKLGRLERFSYSWGGNRQEQSFYEVGRFLQNEFPELGLLDGAEYIYRSDSGSHIGASMGAMPEPFRSLKSGDDFQVAVFYRAESDDPEDIVLGVAYQNTWHKGHNDRNLIIGTLDWSPNEQMSVYGSAWVDYYGGSDDVKSDGLELTELRLNSIYRVNQDTGFGAHVSHTRWPELLRNELEGATIEEILDNKTTRVGVSGWHRLADDVRMDARADYWQDQDDTGGSGDIRVAFRDILFDKGEVAIAFFTTRGSYTDGHGIRLSANRSIGDSTFATLSWENARYERTTLSSGSDKLDQQTLRASIDMVLGAMSNISLYAEKRSGDSQDSKNLGVYFQQRF